MIKIVSALLGAVIIVAAYYGALHFLNQKLPLELSCQGKWISEKKVWFVGGVTAILWIVMNLVRDAAWSVPVTVMTLCIVCGMAVLTITDWMKHTIPNRVLKVLLLLWVMIVGLGIILDMSAGMALLFQCLAGGLVGGLIFLLCYLLSHKQLGAGDVKLVFVLGLYMTGQRIMGAIFYGVVLCCIYSIVALCGKKIGLKDGVPLAPFLYLGMMITLLIL